MRVRLLAPTLSLRPRTQHVCMNRYSPDWLAALRLAVRTKPLHSYGWPTASVRICGRGVGGPYPRIRTSRAAASSPGRNRSHCGAMRW